jgi:hypothetical protein
MSAPAVDIRLELEAAPKVMVDCLNDAGHDRLIDWIDNQPELLDLLARACELRYGAEAA